MLGNLSRQDSIVGWQGPGQSRVMSTPSGLAVLTADSPVHTEVSQRPCEPVPDAVIQDIKIAFWGQLLTWEPPVLVTGAVCHPAGTMGGSEFLSESGEGSLKKGGELTM